MPQHTFFLCLFSSAGPRAYKSAIPSKQSSHLQMSLALEATDPSELAESALSVLTSGRPGGHAKPACSILATRRLSIRDLGLGDDGEAVGSGTLTESGDGGDMERMFCVILDPTLYLLCNF